MHRSIVFPRYITQYAVVVTVHTRVSRISHHRNTPGPFQGPGTAKAFSRNSWSENAQAGHIHELADPGCSSLRDSQRSGDSRGRPDPQRGGGEDQRRGGAWSTSLLLRQPIFGEESRQRGICTMIVLSWPIRGRLFKRCLFGARTPALDRLLRPPSRQGGAAGWRVARGVCRTGLAFRSDRSRYRRG